MPTLSNVSVPAFKNNLGINQIEVIVNPKTNKLFCACDTGMNFAAEQALDVTKELVVLVSIPTPAELQLDSTLDTTYCLINKRNTAEVKITL